VVLLVMKVLLAPVLLAACSLAAWRWGTAVGGWLLGLPLISGPVSFLLFLEHGPVFAESAARGTLLGFLATGAFCTWYVLLARRSRWWFSLPVAYAACLAVAWALSFVDLPVAWVAAGVVAILAGLAILAPSPDACEPVPKPAPRPLLVKMLSASVIVVAITGAAGVLGPRVAGLLAPLPVLLAFMAAAAHRRSGHEAACGLLRGALAGCWGGAAFFAVIALELGVASPGIAYAAALAAGLAGAALAVVFQRGRVIAAVTARARDAQRAVELAWRRAQVRSVRLRARRLRIARTALHLTSR